MLAERRANWTKRKQKRKKGQLPRRVEIQNENHAHLEKRDDFDRMLIFWISKNDGRAGWRFLLGRERLVVDGSLRRGAFRNRTSWRGGSSFRLRRWRDRVDGKGVFGSGDSERRLLDCIKERPKKRWWSVSSAPKRKRRKEKFQLTVPSFCVRSHLPLDLSSNIVPFEGRHPPLPIDIQK